MPVNIYNGLIYVYSKLRTSNRIMPVNIYNGVIYVYRISLMECYNEERDKNRNQIFMT